MKEIEGLKFLDFLDGIYHDWTTCSKMSDKDIEKTIRIVASRKGPKGFVKKYYPKGISYAIAKRRAICDIVGSLPDSYRLRILQVALSYVIVYDYMGICEALNKAVCTFFHVKCVWEVYPDVILPGFTRKAHGINHEDPYWWPLEDREIRIEILEDYISVYKERINRIKT